MSNLPWGLDVYQKIWLYRGSQKNMDEEVHMSKCTSGKGGNVIPLPPVSGTTQPDLRDGNDATVFLFPFTDLTIKSIQDVFRIVEKANRALRNAEAKGSKVEKAAQKAKIREALNSIDVQVLAAPNPLEHEVLRADKIAVMELGKLYWSAYKTWKSVEDLKKAMQMLEYLMFASSSDLNMRGISTYLLCYFIQESLRKKLGAESALQNPPQEVLRIMRQVVREADIGDDISEADIVSFKKAIHDMDRLLNKRAS